jgi:hypothetical protein
MYEQTVKLQHNEVAAKINVETGELQEVSKRPNNIPGNKEVFDYDKAWFKSYEKSWLFLIDNLKSHELKIALKMASMTEFSTNSLAPLDDKMQLKQLSELFNIGINQVKKAFENLFKIGVYASFKYSHYRRGPVEEWVFNPFISFKGKLVDSDLKNLFVNTPIARHFFS